MLVSNHQRYENPHFYVMQAFIRMKANAKNTQYKEKEPSKNMEERSGRRLYLALKL